MQGMGWGGQGQGIVLQPSDACSETIPSTPGRELKDTSQLGLLGGPALPGVLQERKKNAISSQWESILLSTPLSIFNFKLEFWPVWFFSGDEGRGGNFVEDNVYLKWDRSLLEPRGCCDCKEDRTCILKTEKQKTATAPWCPDQGWSMSQPWRQAGSNAYAWDPTNCKKSWSEKKKTHQCSFLMNNICWSCSICYYGNFCHELWMINNRQWKRCP